MTDKKPKEIVNITEYQKSVITKIDDPIVVSVFDSIIAEATQLREECTRRRRLEIRALMKATDFDCLLDKAVEMLKRCQWRKRELYRGVEADIFCISCNSDKESGCSDDCELSKFLEKCKDREVEIIGPSSRELKEGWDINIVEDSINE